MKSNCPSDALSAEFRQVCSRRQSLLEPSQKSWIGAWLHDLLNFLTGSQTLNIVQRSRADGTVQWIVHDPDAAHPRIFDSEQAVRVWLERRYYQ